MNTYYRAFLWLIPALLLISFLGFYKTYFGLFPRFTTTTWIIHFHVFSILCWFILLLAQVWFAKSGKMDLHRKMGRISYLWVPVVVVGFLLVTHQGQLQNKEPDLLGAVLFDGVLFILFYVLAMLHVKNTAYHAQYMILSAIPFINPGLGRFIAPEVSVPVEFLLILVLFASAYFKKKPYRPYLVAIGSFIVMLGIIVYISVIQPEIIDSVWTLIWG